MQSSGMVKSDCFLKPNDCCKNGHMFMRRESPFHVVAFLHVAMGQNSVPPVNIPNPTKIGSKMGGAPKTPKMGSHGS